MTVSVIVAVHGSINAIFVFDSVPARVAKGQGAKEIGQNLAL